MNSKVPVYRGCEEPIICNEIPTRKPDLPRVTRNTAMAISCRCRKPKSSHSPNMPSSIWSKSSWKAMAISMWQPSAR